MNQGQIIADMYRIRDELVAKFPEHTTMLLSLDLGVSRRMVSRLGHCKFMGNAPYRIEVSWRAYQHDANRSKLDDTIRHEFAHALAGINAGHSWAWKAWAVKVGANPNARTESNQLAVSPLKPRVLVEIACNSCKRPLTVTERQATMVRNGTRNYRHKGCPSKQAPDFN